MIGQSNYFGFGFTTQLKTALLALVNNNHHSISVLLLVFGWSGIVPAIHLISEYGVELVMRQVALDWMGLMSFLYTLSAVTYATRIPEKFFPGKCDIWVSRMTSSKSKTGFRTMAIDRSPPIPAVTNFQISCCAPDC